jgi:hypothetical protein
MPALKKVYDMSYFWNIFLPLLIFLFTGSMLFIVLNTSDELLSAASVSAGTSGANVILAAAAAAKNSANQ